MIIAIINSCKQELLSFAMRTKKHGIEHLTLLLGVAVALLLHAGLLMSWSLLSPAAPANTTTAVVMETFMLAPPALAPAPAQPTQTDAAEQVVQPKEEAVAQVVRPKRPPVQKRVARPAPTPAAQPQPAAVETPTAAAQPTAAKSVAVAPAAPVLVTKPQFLVPPSQPVYPPVAQRRGQQGTVWLEILLSESGKQLKLSITRSSGVESLDNAAKVAVAEWKFAPYRMNGMAVLSRVQVPVEFVIQ